MLENGTATAADEIVETDIYDGLGQAGQDVWDLIGSYGFRPDKNDEGEWVALETRTGGDRVIGPCVSLSALATEVEQEVGSGQRSAAIAGFAASDEAEDQAMDDDSAVVEIDEDHKGNTYLPGVKPVVDTQLATAAGDYFAANGEWKEAGKKRTDKQSVLNTVVQMKRDLFKQDPDNTNSLIYHAGGLLIRIAKEQKTKVTVEEDEDDG